MGLQPILLDQIFLTKKPSQIFEIRISTISHLAVIWVFTKIISLVYEIHVVPTANTI